jgi:hypothetical protein
VIVTAPAPAVKALVWKDATDATWLSCNDPSWLAKRHRLGHGVDGAVNAMTAALAAVAKAAMASQQRSKPTSGASSAVIWVSKSIDEALHDPRLQRSCC